MLYRRSRCLSRIALTALALIAVPGIGAAPLQTIIKPDRIARSAHQNRWPCSLDIPAQDLSAALTQFGRETGTEIVFAPESVREKKAVAVKGEFERVRALQLLLEGSGLTYRVTSQGAIVVEPSKTIAKTGQTSAMLLTQSDQTQSSSQKSEDQDSRSQDASRQDSRSEERRHSRIEEIIVTAQKREESLQEVPISISVLSGQELDRDGGLTEIREALSRVPGVMIEESVGNGGQVSIRGVSAGQSFGTGSSTTAFYLDNVPFGFVNSARAPEVGPYDLDRVEVLRGPQGTLYGASALNGVVRILTKDPRLDGFDFKARLGASNSTRSSHGVNSRADAAVNIPIIEDRLAARATVSYSRLAGLDRQADRREKRRQ